MGNSESTQHLLVKLLAASADSEWLRDIACADENPDDFFVDAGRTMPQEKVNLCRGCPVRSDCLAHAYSRDIGAGFYGGLSPKQRRDMTLEEALSFIEDDPVRDLSRPPRRRSKKTS